MPLEIYQILTIFFTMVEEKFELKCSNAKSSLDFESCCVVLFDSEDFSPPLEHAMYDTLSTLNEYSPLKSEIKNLFPLRFKLFKNKSPLKRGGLKPCLPPENGTKWTNLEAGSGYYMVVGLFYDYTLPAIALNQVLGHLDPSRY